MKRIKTRKETKSNDAPRGAHKPQKQNPHENKKKTTTETPNSTTTLAPSFAGGLALAGIEISRCGAIINDDATPEILAGGLRSLVQVQNIIDYIKSDIMQGLVKKSKAKAEEICTELGLSYSETDALLTIASVPLAIRRTELTPAHHKIIGRARMTFANQKKWLDIAVKEKLTVRELADSIEAGTVKKNPENDWAGLVTATQVSSIFQNWRRESMRRTPLEKWPRSAVASAIEELQPIVDFVTELNNRAAQGDFGI